MRRIKIQSRIILSFLLLAVSIQAKDIYATFDVAAKKSANLAFTSSGTVESVFVDVSAVMEKGEMLAQLQNSDFQAALDIARTALKYAKKDFDRQLKVKKLVDALKFDSYAFKYENAKAQYAYQLALFNKTVLTAPFDGIIFEKSVEEGDVVSGAMIRTVFKIQSKHKRKIILSFDQKYHKDVKVGQTYKYKLDGDKTEYTGVISKIYPFANADNRKIRAEVKAKDFMVGLFGDGYILIDDTNSTDKK